MVAVIDRLAVAPVARLVARGRDVDGRLVVLAVVGLYVVAVAAFEVFADLDLWRKLGVPSGPSLYYDARNVTAAVDCDRLGYDPLVDNPCDPTGRPMNYPRFWLALGWLGLRQSHTLAFGTVIVLLFVGVLLLFLRRLTVGEGVVVAALVASPAIMLALERANMDLVLFLLVAVAALLARTRSPATDRAGPLLVGVAALGKIYPAFALPAYLATRRRVARGMAIVSAVLVGLYALVSLDDLQVATSATQGDYYAYGARILPSRLYHNTIADTWSGGAAAAQAIAVLLLGAVLVVVWRTARRRFPWDESLPSDPATLLAFHLGVLAFLGTFAIRNNWDYRLVFVLLTVPQLLAWAQDGAHRLHRLGCLTLAVLVVDLWAGGWSETLHLADELGSWALAALFVTLLAGTLPPLLDVVPAASTVQALTGTFRRLVGEGEAGTSMEPVRRSFVHEDTPEPVVAEAVVADATPEYRPPALLQSAIKYLHVVVALAVLGALAGYVYEARKPTLYLASAQLLLTDPREPNITDDDPNFANIEPDRYLRDQGVLVTSEPVVRRALELVGGGDVPEINIDPAFNFNQLSIHVADTTPERAAKFADALAVSYTREQIERRRRDASTAIETLLASEADLRERLQRIDETGGAAASAERDAAVTQLTEFASRRRELALRSKLEDGGVRHRQSARVPGSPFQPEPTRSAGVGGLVGLAGGVAAAWVWNDRRLRRAAARQ